ncbi:AMP-binding protein [Micromonospora arborensis]|uniref:AMP-binding protein n=1 Tax=Micromonospora arborensis TaxID=2116518 RepID=UPI0033F57D24
MTMDLARLWHALAGQQPDRPALIHGTRTLSWRQFDDAAAGFADTLRRSGVRRGEIVALCLPNAPEYLICVAGAMRCGAIPCGISPRLGPEELAALLRRIEPAVVCYDVADVADVAQAGCQLPMVRHWYAIEGDTLTAGFARLALNDNPRQSWFDSWPDDVLLLPRCTGRASGNLNAVRWRISDLLTQVYTPSSWRRYRSEGHEAPAPAVHPPIRLLLASPLVHAAGLTRAVAALSAGGAVITLPGSVFDPELLLDTLVHQQATDLAITGDVHARAFTDALDAEPNRWHLGQLSIITSSGTAWSHDTKRRVLDHQSHLRLLESVDSTEVPALGFSVAMTGSVPPTGEFTLGRHARVFSEGRPARPGDVGEIGVSWPHPTGLHPSGQLPAGRFVHHGGAYCLLSGDQVQMIGPRRFLLLGPVRELNA